MSNNKYPVLSMSIEDFVDTYANQEKVRIKNCLYSSNIHFFAQLLTYNKAYFMGPNKPRGFGENSLLSLQEALDNLSQEQEKPYTLGSISLSEDVLVTEDVSKLCSYLDTTDYGPASTGERATYEISNSGIVVTITLGPDFQAALQKNPKLLDGLVISFGTKAAVSSKPSSDIPPGLEKN